MSYLDRVTITGADDNTDISDMVSLSKEFPFVEWGILLSEKYKGQGSKRFPSDKWLELLGETMDEQFKNPVSLSAHLCGSYVKTFLKDPYYRLPAQLESYALNSCERIQVNVGARVITDPSPYLVRDLADSEYHFIIQYSPSSRQLYEAIKFFTPVSPLYDMSGGKGILPHSWIDNYPHDYCGYAGGLDPDNLRSQLDKIDQLREFKYWIDLESGVRTDDKLDMKKVRKVLTIAKDYLMPKV